jgi:prevent-host-death family protein
MKIIKVNMHQAKTSLSRLVQAVEERGETVVVCRNGRPVARLVPHTGESLDHFRRDPRLAGVLMEDPVTPLPPEAWPEVQ